MASYGQRKKRRDTAIKKRFDFLYKSEKKRLDHVWEQLEREFYISIPRIQQILREYDENYLKDEQNKPTGTD